MKVQKIIMLEIKEDKVYYYAVVLSSMLLSLSSLKKDIVKNGRSKVRKE